jgi:MOSC domain-containing protein YiiM
MTGRVEAIHIAPRAGVPMRAMAEARAIAGAGLAGDRYQAGTGHYSTRPLPGGGRQLTLIEAEALEALRHETGIALTPAESRRNITTRGVRLNDLVGRRFYVGEVLCEGVRLCEPCAYLEGLTGKAVNRPLVRRGGLRASILTGGIIRLGDGVREATVGARRATAALCSG